MEGQREHAFEYRLLTEKKKSTTERERQRKREGNREKESRVLFQKDTESKDGHINREKKIGEAKTYQCTAPDDYKILLGRQRDTVEHLHPRTGLLVESRKCQLRNDCILTNSSSSRCSL
jgi:hypothetical protein